MNQWYCLSKKYLVYFPTYTTLRIINRVRGQYRYSWYLRDAIGWKLRHSGQYSPVLLAAIATAELFKYVSINKHRKIFEKFTTLCRTVSSFSDCQKHEYITVKTLQGDEEMKALQCLHFLSIIHGLIIFPGSLDFISYSFLFRRVAVYKPG